MQQGGDTGSGLPRAKIDILSDGFLIVVLAITSLDLVPDYYQ